MSKKLEQQAQNELREMEAQFPGGVSDEMEEQPPGDWQTKGAAGLMENPRAVETLLVPLDPNGNSDSVFLCVNGKNLLVKRGVSVQVAPEFAEAYRNAQRQQLAAVQAQQAAMSRE